MPADPVAQLVRVYEDAEAGLLHTLADEVRRAINRGDESGEAQARLAAVQRLRRHAQQTVRGLDHQAPGLLRQVLETAATLGARLALGPLAQLLGVTPGNTREPFNRQALDRLAASVTDLVTEANQAILRTTDDAYRDVLARATPRLLVGADTRRQASQRALWALSDRGISGFTDRAGRRWKLSSYVEMAARTSAQRATTDAQGDRLLAAGINLVIVSDNVQECTLCRPWEGEILALTGTAGRVLVEHATRDGEQVEVHVKATLAEARAAGLFHPNCRHAISAYLPGITKRATGAGRGPDPEGDKARDRQRAIERHIRHWKARRDAALDPAAQRWADQHVRAWQQHMRDHLADNPDLKRLRYREAPGAGSTPTRTLVDRNPDGPLPNLPDDREDLTRFDDDQLDHELQAALVAEDMDRFDLLSTEADRRDSERQAAEAKREKDRARREARKAADDERKAAELDRLLEQGDDEESAVEQVYGISVDRQRRDRAIGQLRGQGYTGRGFDELARASFRDHVYEQYLAAEDATRGHMLSRRALARGVDPHALFTGPEAVARANASDELLEWWDQHGRPTYDQWTAQLLGERPTDGPREDFLR